MENNLPYRPCAGIMMLNRKSEVFVAKRIDMVAEAWQMPQGGIDDGEDPRSAALRELMEETGTNNVDVLRELDDWLTYDLPDELIGKIWKGRYRGQRMKWFAVRFLGQDDQIDINTPHPEFSEWKWINMQKLPDVIVPFKRDLYQTLVDHFHDLT